ncbi:MAG TPA: hypothetical protein VFE03_11825 [Caulobacteraceae bacterium]|nr:hypothetical protein [Caulobacteraceae bacterium]
MDLTDRYFSAIRFNLPAAQADDIIAELRDVLLTQREEEETRLGRPLNSGEVEALIKAFGHPLVVAARYGRRQYLIGPEIYPFYAFTLKAVLLIVSAVLVTLAIAGVVFSVGDPGKVIARAWGAIWTAGFVATGVITVIFAAMERYAPPARFLRNWRPRDLPRFSDKGESRWSAISGITAGAVFILWWTGAIHFPHTLTSGHGPRVDVMLAPIWAQFYWPIIGVTAFGMVGLALRLVRPNWLRVRSVVNITAGGAGLLILALIYRAGDWAVVAGAGVSAAELAKVEYGIDIGLRVTLVVVGVIWTLQCLYEGWRIWRASQASRGD